MKRRHLLLKVIPGLAAAGTLGSCRRRPVLDQETYREEIIGTIKNYAEVCSSAYRIAWQKADTLRGQISLFLSQPDAQGWAAVRQTWSEAFLSYMETEGLRGFGTPADSYHRRIQAWPVLPATLDTVPGQPKAGLVHDTKGFPEITAETLLAAHQPADDKVLVGFHALEFLIFGIDLYEDGGGYRAFTDYTRALGADRRRTLLETLAQLLSDDLHQLTDAWHPSQGESFRNQFVNKPSSEALSIIFTGLINPCATGLDGKLDRPLSSGEETDEVGNFSDTSLEAIRHALTGLQRTMAGEAPGRVLSGEELPLNALIAKADPSLASSIESAWPALLATLEPLEQPFDQLMKPGNPGRPALESVSASLKEQAERLRDAARALGAGTATDAA